MRFPIIGSLKKKSYISVSGGSVPTGFVLEIRNYKISPPARMIFHTEKFHEGLEAFNYNFRLGNIARIVSYSMALLATLLLFSSSQSSFITTFMGILLFLPIMFFMQSFIHSVAQVACDRDLQEWHGCEHKLIAILEDGAYPSIENIKKYPKTDIFCGTSYVSIFIQMVFAMWCLGMNFFNIITFPEYALFAFRYLCLSGLLFLLCTFTTARLLYIYRTFLLFPLVVFMLPALVIPLGIEYCFAVRNPSEEKIREVLEEFTPLFRSLEIFKP